MPLKLRPASIADAPILTDILHRSKGSWGYPKDKMAEFREYWRITEDDIDQLHMTIAEIDGIAVAFSGVKPINEDTLLIDYLFVVPETQGQGIGYLLLKRVEDRARTLGLTRLYLESDAYAGSFYETQGFTTIATRPSEMSPGKDIPLMEKSLPASIHKVSTIDLRISQNPWSFEERNTDAISAHFLEAQKRIALLWNGRVLKLTGYQFENGKFSGECANCSFASYLAWRDWGAPDPNAHNIFGSAILRTPDNALLYGVMSDRTATGGMIYPPGGNLDPTDLTKDGKVDILGAIYRELEEETGLTRQDVTERELLIAFDGPRISICRLFDLDQTAEVLREKIMSFAKASEEQELADIRIIRSRDDLSDPMIVPYAREVGEFLLGFSTPHDLA